MQHVPCCRIENSLFGSIVIALITIPVQIEQDTK